MSSLLDLVLRLLGGDEELTTAYHQDPAGFANKYFGDLCGDDWKDLHLVLDQSGVVERHPDTEAHPEHSYKHHHEGGHAVTQLHNIVNNYTQIDDRHTVTDQSTTQVINTGGGDFWQRIDNGSTTASGDGAVAAGHDVNGNVNNGQFDNSDKSVHSSDNHATIVSGDGNLVGDHDTGNAVGDHDKVDNSGHQDVSVSHDHDGGSPDHDEVSHDHDEKKPGDDMKHHDAGGPEHHYVDHSEHQDSPVGSFDHNDDSFNNDESFNHNDDSFNHYNDSFNHSTVADNVVDDHSSTEQHGLVNVNDVLSHNNVPIDVDVPIHIL